MSTTTLVVASAVIAVMVVIAVQQLVLLARKDAPVWRAAVMSQAGFVLRLALVALLYGVVLLLDTGRHPVARWVVLSIEAAILAWNIAVLLKSRVRRPAGHAPGNE